LFSVAALEETPQPNPFNHLKLLPRSDGDSPLSTNY
jgi:hypothetical protein